MCGMCKKKYEKWYNVVTRPTNHPKELNMVPQNSNTVGTTLRPQLVCQQSTLTME